jgi:hypothetical protein
VQLADRADFVAQLKALCAGFNVPFTPEREEAYWRGLERMQVSQFARVVTHALGEQGPERIPTVREVWALQRVMRRRQVESRPLMGEAQPPADNYTAFANRRLLAYLVKHGPVGDLTLKRLVETKERVAGQFRLIETEEKITEQEFRDSLIRSFDRDVSLAATAGIAA